MFLGPHKKKDNDDVEIDALKKENESIKKKLENIEKKSKCLK